MLFTSELVINRSVTFPMPQMNTKKQTIHLDVALTFDEPVSDLNTVVSRVLDGLIDQVERADGIAPDDEEALTEKIEVTFRQADQKTAE